MGKDLYDFLNDMEIDLDRYEKKELSDLEKEKYKKVIDKKIKTNNKRVKKWTKNFITIAASIILLFTLSKTEIGRSTYVLAGEIFANIKYSIKDGLEFEDDIDKYSSKIGLISESDGVKIKLNDVIVDRDKVYLTFLIDVNQYIAREYLEDDNLAFNLSFLENGSYKMTMNGKEMRMGFIKTSIGFPDRKVEDRTWVTEVRNKESRDKGIFDIVVEAENPLEGDMKELKSIDFKLNFNYLGIDVYQSYIIESEQKEEPFHEKIGEFYGDWKFEFSRDVEELSIATDKYKLDERLSLEGLDIDLIELTCNPLGNKIQARIKERGFYEEEFKTNILLDGYDNLGQRRSFSFILEEGENTIMIKEHFNQIDYPKYKEYPGSFFKDANLDFKDIEYIEFTPYYKKGKRGFGILGKDPIMRHKKMGEAFKLYLNKSN